MSTRPPINLFTQLPDWGVAFCLKSIKPEAVQIRPWDSVFDRDGPRVVVLGTQLEDPMQVMLVGANQFMFSWLTKKDLEDLRQGHAVLVLDCSTEGRRMFPALWSKLHTQLDLHKIPASHVVYLTQNLEFPRIYKAWCDKKNINPLHVHIMNMWARWLMACANDEFGDKLQIEQLVQAIGQPRPRGKKFLCLNRRPCDHRLRLLLSLIRDQIFDEGLVSFLQFKLNTSFMGLKRVRSFEPELNNFLKTPHGKDLEPYLPDLVAKGVRVIGADSARQLNGLADPQCYHSTYFSLVTESEMAHADNNQRVSEKILKPLFFGHPLINFGNAGSLNLLREWGFKTFSPFIDESYDQIHDRDARFRAAYSEARRLIALSYDELEKLRADLHDILVHNSRWMLNGFSQRLQELYEEPTLTLLQDLVTSPEWIVRTKTTSLQHTLLVATKTEPKPHETLRTMHAAGAPIVWRSSDKVQGEGAYAYCLTARPSTSTKPWLEAFDFDGLPENVCDDMRRGQAQLILDDSQATRAFDSEDLRRVADKLRAMGLPTVKVTLLSANLVYAGAVKKWRAKGPAHEGAYEGTNGGRTLQVHGYCGRLRRQAHALSQGLCQLAPWRPRQQNRQGGAQQGRAYVCLSSEASLHQAAALLRLEAKSQLQRGHLNYQPPRPEDLQSWQRDKLFQTLNLDVAALENAAARFTQQTAPNKSPADARKDPATTDFTAIIPHQFKNSFFSIICEGQMSSGEIVSLGESALKAMASFHPFILLGNPHSLAILKNLGFKTFHPFIDESYDQILDPGQRFSRALDEIEKLLAKPNKELHSWYYAMEEILSFNANLAREQLDARLTALQDIPLVQTLASQSQRVAVEPGLNT